MADRALSKMTRGNVLCALGAPKMQWFDLWEDKKIQAIYHRLRRYDHRFQLTPGSKGQHAGRIWKSESFILSQILQQPETFSTTYLDKEFKKFTHSDLLVFSVQDLIDTCKHYPLFEGNRYTKTKIRAALGLLMKIYTTCKGRSMREVHPQGKASRLGPVISSDKNDWYEVLQRRVYGWMGGFIGEREVLYGYYDQHV